MEFLSHHANELTRLKDRILFMGGLAEESVELSIKALAERNDASANEVKSQDSALDDLEVEIDELCLRLLAKAPLASELRFVTVAMKIARDLERIGDEATTIARRALELNGEPQIKPNIDLPHMSRLALHMLKQALDAFVSRNTANARDVIPQDKAVNALHRQFQRELIAFMSANPASIARALNLLTISKSLERIADHATNIAEEVIFIVEGRDIRHVA